MNPALLIGIAAIAFIALRGSDEDEAVSNGNNGANGGEPPGDDESDDLDESPNSGEVSGPNGTWRWTVFSVTDRISGIDAGSSTGFRWLVGKIDDVSQDAEGREDTQAKAREAALVKATQMAFMRDPSRTFKLQ